MRGIVFPCEFNKKGRGLDVYEGQIKDYLKMALMISVIRKIINKHRQVKPYDGSRPNVQLHPIIAKVIQCMQSRSPRIRT